MRSSLISKIEKAHRYAQEKDRVSIRDISVDFRGENDSHTVTQSNKTWHCTCHFFESWETCSHVIAMQKILGDMLPEETRSSFE